MSDVINTPLRLEEVDGILVVQFASPRLVDEDRINDVSEQLIRLVEEDGRRRILLNFHEVNYLSSAVIGIMMKLNKKLARVDGVMKLCGLKPIHLELFKATRLDKMFSIYPDEPTALDSF
jgi:anti-sigma B factor antagonist